MKRLGAAIRRYAGAIVFIALSSAACQEHGRSKFPFTQLEVSRILSCPSAAGVTPQWHSVDAKTTGMQVRLPPFADLKTAEMLAETGAEVLAATGDYSFSVA